MIHKSIKLATSNQNKINEYTRFGLKFEVVKGKDLPEVKSDIDTVILYKALDAAKEEENILVEDTVLVVNGEEIVDIRWKISELEKLKNPKIQWITSLGIVEDNIFYCYQAKIDCKLVKDADKVNVPEDAFGFDPYLIPLTDNNETNQSYTFYELEKMGKKDKFSPRLKATELLINGNVTTKINISDVPEWNGEYQHD